MFAKICVLGAAISLERIVLEMLNFSKNSSRVSGALKNHLKCWVSGAENNPGEKKKSP